ncbi:MAG: hypothetical protein DMD84_21380 [Candidatus Rokuibacteriota bacterium]|nr:MAG: hypothetical protein DMD84_21380 [Candidatus Rokubacteria bacterium]
MTDFTTVRSSSSLMARSAASARSSMLMAWIIATPAQQIFTFGTHQLHAGRPSSACGLTKARHITTRRTVMTTRTIQRVTTVFLMAAAIVVVGLVSVRAHAQGPAGMHAGMMKRMISAALDEALDQAAVTAEQRTAIYASRDRVFAAMEAQRPDRGAQREQVLALFEGDRLDATQLQAVHAQMAQRRQAIGDAITQAIVEIHDTLTPVQRQIVASYARTHGPRGMR